MNTSLIADYGTWDDNEQYNIIILQGAPGIVIAPQVKYEGKTYVANSSSTPILGTAPNIDTAWTGDDTVSNPSSLTAILKAAQTLNITATASNIPLSNSTNFTTTITGTALALTSDTVTLTQGFVWNLTIKAQGSNFNAVGAELILNATINGTSLATQYAASSIGIEVGALVKGSQGFMQVIIDTTATGYNAGVSLLIKAQMDTGNTCDITTADSFYIEITN